MNHFFPYRLVPQTHYLTLHLSTLKHSTSLEHPVRDILTLNMSTHILAQKHAIRINPSQHLLEILEFRVYHLESLGSQDMLFRPVWSSAIGL